MLDALRSLLLGPEGLLGVILGALLAALNDWLARKRSEAAYQDLGRSQAEAAGNAEIVAMQTEIKDEEDRARKLPRSELVDRLSKH